MSAKPRSLLVSLSLVLTACSGGSSGIPELPSESTRTNEDHRISAALTDLPLSFVQNRGQADPRVGYYLQGSDTSVYFTPGGLRLSFQDTTGTAQRWNLALDFVGARPTAPQGMGKTPAVVSYFKGNRKDWHTGVPTYARVAYRDLWPGIDLVYKGTGSRLKYSFVVHSRADAKDIRLKWRGATALTVDEKDRLLVSTPARSFTDEAPLSHQMIRGRKLTVATSYSVDGTTYGFDLGAYDPTRALVIDPAMLLYAGYIGGSGTDSANGIAVDGSGAAYITGSTISTEATFPEAVGPDLTHNGNNDAFVAKVAPSGASLSYAGYIGGSVVDFGHGIAVDAAGAAYVTGQTESTQATFPDGDGLGTLAGPDLTHNGGNDAFVAKVAPSGALLTYAGYIGGPAFDTASGVAVDGTGAAYISGRSDSSETTFPDGDGFGPVPGPDLTQNGMGDAFVAKVSPSGGSLNYAGYIGGSALDTASGVAVDGAGAAFVTGNTLSTEATFPEVVGPDLTYNEGTDAFVAKVAPGGTSLSYAGYVGGSAADSGLGVTVDGTGAAYVTGDTSSTEATFPEVVGPDLSYNGIRDAFVAKVAASGASLIYAGFIGGNDFDFGSGIAVDASGAAYITGTTTSTQATFPDGDGLGTLAGPDLTHNGGNDAFVAKVEAFPPPGPGSAPSPAGGICQGKAVTHLGTEGNDVLIGTPQADVVLGLGGKDTIRTKGGNDRICAGRGNDTVKGGAGKDRLLGQRGNDNLDGGAGRDLCRGGPGRDRIRRCERGGG